MYMDFSDGWKQERRGSTLDLSDLSLADRTVRTYKRINPLTRQPEVFHTFLLSMSTPAQLVKT